MSSPFPGMDPFLEHPALWPDVHNGLIAELRNTIAPALRPRYYVRLEERTYLSEPDGLMFVGRPDLAIVRTSPRGASPEALGPGASSGTALLVEVPVPDTIRETYLEVRAVEDGEVVTVLEVLSPTNKLPGRGRAIYQDTRHAILATRTSLVEIDLVRAGQPMPVLGAPPASEYRVLVSPGYRRPAAQLFPFSLREAIPAFPLPLRKGEAEPPVDVGAVLRTLYERAGYDLSIDYRSAPVPPLGGAVAAWADGLLRDAGLR